MNGFGDVWGEHLLSMGKEFSDSVTWAWAGFAEAEWGPSLHQEERNLVGDIRPGVFTARIALSLVAIYSIQ